MKTETIDRKEIADKVDVSVDTVVRRETEWGIDKFRLPHLKKPILYSRLQVSDTLLRLKIISQPL